MARRPGPELPYAVVAGVTPWGRKWVTASAKVSGSNFAPEPPHLYSSFVEVLDERPSFSVIVINAPIGYVERPGAGRRACDHGARVLLGARGMTIHNAPTRTTLAGETHWTEDHLDAVTAMMLPSYKEVAAEMFPYRQRTVYEGQPELSFFQLNSDSPLLRSKRVESGRDERRAALVHRVPGVEKILNAELEGTPKKHLYDAAALLWSARRVFGHAAKRIPEDAQWDSEGLRMEIVY